MANAAFPVARDPDRTVPSTLRESLLLTGYYTSQMLPEFRINKTLWNSVFMLCCFYSMEFQGIS